MLIQTKLARNREYICSVYHVKELGVFGSYASGRQTAGSDVDILVDFEDGHRDFFNYMRLKQYLEKMLGKKIDLVMKKAVKKRLKDRILRQVLYV
ncbi:MAG: nucleotidyltransferase [Thermodesulfovibrionales bacterium]